MASLANDEKSQEGKEKARRRPEAEPCAPGEHPPTVRYDSFEEQPDELGSVDADRKSIVESKVDVSERGKSKLEGAFAQLSSQSDTCAKQPELKSDNIVTEGGRTRYSEGKDAARRMQEGKSPPEHPPSARSSSLEESDTSTCCSDSDSRPEIESDNVDLSRSDPDGKNNVDGGHELERRRLRPEGESEPSEEIYASAESNEHPELEDGYTDNPTNSTVDTYHQPHYDLQSSVICFQGGIEQTQLTALTSEENFKDIGVHNTEDDIDPAKSDQLDELSEQYLSDTSSNADDEGAHNSQGDRRAAKKLAKGYRREKVEHEKARQKNMELQQRKEQLNHEIEVLQKRNDSLDFQLSSVKKQLLSAEQQQDELCQTIQELSARTDAMDIDTLEERDKEIDKLKSEKSRLAKELTEVTDKVKQLETDKAELESFISTNKKTISTFECILDPGSFNITNYAAQSENRKCRVCYRVADPEVCSKCNRLKNKHWKQDGICNKFKERKISRCHAYGEKLLVTACRGNYPAVWEAGADRQRKPSECKWLQQCNGCDSATGNAEKNFEDIFGVVIDEASKYYLGDSSCRIQVDHADLMHVYTFRALCHNVDVNHFFISECTCNELFPSIRAFLKRAHHLCQPAVWNGREVSSQYIDPTDAGMLFHLCQSPVPDHHLIEFPIICEVQLAAPAHLQSSHALSSVGSLPQPQSASSCTLMYAQIPPFYWAFPLVEPAKTLPRVFPEAIKTAQTLVANYYVEVKKEAKRLQTHFPAIVNAVNGILQEKKEAVFKPGSAAQQWRDIELKIKREDRDVKAEELKALIEENSQKRKQSEVDQSSIDSRREELKKEEKTLRDKEQEIRKQIEDAEKKSEKQRLENLLKENVARQSLLTPKVKQLNEGELQVCQLKENFFKEYHDIEHKKKKLIEEGLYADFTPKLMLTYLPCCCLKVTMS